MRLLLDEMLSPEIAARLRERGHDAEAINGHSEWESLSDAEVMDLARLTRRAVVTNNVADFRRLHHQAVSPGGEGHYGMVFMPGTYRRRRADIGKIVRALEAELARRTGDDALASAEAWL